MKKPAAAYKYWLPMIALAPSLVAPGILSIALAAIAIALVAKFWKSYDLHFSWSSRAFWSGILVFVLWVALADWYNFTPRDVDFAVIILAFLFAAPIVEELFLRDFANRFFQNTTKKLPKKGLFTATSFIGVVLLNAVMYVQHWPTGLMVGLVFGWVVWRDGKRESGILAHFTANAAILLYAALTNGYFLFF